MHPNPETIRFLGSANHCRPFLVCKIHVELLDHRLVRLLIPRGIELEVCSGMHRIAIERRAVRTRMICIFGLQSKHHASLECSEDFIPAGLSFGQPLQEEEERAPRKTIIGS